MARIKLDQDLMGLSPLLERLTGTKVKDCFKDEAGETIYFVVEEGQLGKAIGKGGVNVKNVQNELHKRVRIIEYKDNVTDFIRNIIYPLTVEEIREENNVVLLRESSKKTKSLLIGREGKHLKLINRAVQRFFNVEEVKFI